jgi:hypothetical protein
MIYYCKHNSLLKLLARILSNTSPASRESTGKYFPNHFNRTAVWLRITLHYMKMPSVQIIITFLRKERMEAAGAAKIVRRIFANEGDKCYVTHLVTDDDSSVRKIVTHYFRVLLAALKITDDEWPRYRNGQKSLTMVYCRYFM